MRCVKFKRIAAALFFATCLGPISGQAVHDAVSESMKPETAVEALHSLCQELGLLSMACEKADSFEQVSQQLVGTVGGACTAAFITPQEIELNIVAGFAAGDSRIRWMDTMNTVVSGLKEASLVGSTGHFETVRKLIKAAHKRCVTLESAYAVYKAARGQGEPVYKAYAAVIVARRSLATQAGTTPSDE